MASQRRTSQGPVFSLLVARDSGRVLTIGGGATLAVFSGVEEARMFLRFAVGRGGWEVRRTSSGELVSMLDGPYAATESVALDPSPEMLVEGLMSLVSLASYRFVEEIRRALSVKHDNGRHLSRSGDEGVPAIECAAEVPPSASPRVTRHEGTAGGRDQ